MIVNDVCAEFVVTVDVASVRTNCVESRPSIVSAMNADGTDPKIFRGDISPSHTGTPADPPTSIPRYNV